jgi:hypothetical protein
MVSPFKKLIIVVSFPVTIMLLLYMVREVYGEPYIQAYTHSSIIIDEMPSETLEAVVEGEFEHNGCDGVDLYNPNLMPDIKCIPVRLTVYWPWSCINMNTTPWTIKDLNINCDADPFHISTGLDVVETMNQVVSACPPEYVGLHSDTTTVFTINVNGTDLEFWCADRGGAVNVKYWDVWNQHTKKTESMWVISIDVMDAENSIPWFLGVHYNWETEQRSWDELREILY